MCCILLVFLSSYFAHDERSQEPKTLHVSDSFTVHHQQFFTVHTATVYVIRDTVTGCEQDQDGTASCMTYTVAVCTVKNC